MIGTLYIVATPIGNLEDITYRAVRVLKEANQIVAEQPNVSRKLLEHYGIKTHPVKLNQHAGRRAFTKVLAALREGKAVAYITSAGTPGISDPGAKLVEVVRSEFGDDVAIVPVPGPAAVTTLASVAGVPVDRFHFMGFPPQKRGRRKFFERVAGFREPVILYESPHRILKTLRELADVVGDSRHAVIGRELTKQFEEIMDGTLGELLEHVEESMPRGEYTLLIAPEAR